MSIPKNSVFNNDAFLIGSVKWTKFILEQMYWFPGAEQGALAVYRDRGQWLLLTKSHDRETDFQYLKTPIKDKVEDLNMQNYFSFILYSWLFIFRMRILACIRMWIWMYTASGTYLSVTWAKESRCWTRLLCYYYCYYFSPLMKKEKKPNPSVQWLLFEMLEDPAHCLP